MYFYVQEAKYGEPFRGRTAVKVCFCFAFNQGGARIPHTLTPIHAKYVATNNQSTNVHPEPNELVIQEIPTPVKWDKLDKELRQGAKNVFGECIYGQC